MAKLHQIFVGCPFAKSVRAPFDRLKLELEAETPLHVVLADTVGVTSSDYLLDHITELISDSAGCIFDATGANPNVSLEVGIAHTVPVDFMLVFKTRKHPTKKGSTDKAKESEVKSIISDLQGKNRIEYKTYDSLKEQLLKKYLCTLPYMKRWAAFSEEHSAMVPYTTKLFSDLRSSGRSLTQRLAASLEGSGISTSSVTAALTRAKLVSIQRGRTGGILYPQK